MAVRQSCIVVLTLVLLLLWCGGTEAQCTEYNYTAPTIPDSFLPFGTGARDSALPDGPDDKDVTSSAISLSTPFRYYGYSYSICHVSVNGLLSFNVAVAGQAPNVQFSIDQAIIAPYWADIVLDNNDGAVYYRATADSTELQQLTADIRDKYATPFKFTASQAVVVTWVNVTHKDGECYSPVSTFQLVLVTDGRYSFVIFNYAGLDWNEGSLPATNPLAGFTVNTEYTYQLPDSGTADVTDLATTSNIGQNGVWMFRVDTRPFVTQLCEDNGDTLTLSPDVASPQGGSRILLSGPCIAVSVEIKLKINGVEVDVTHVDGHRLEAIVPALWIKGDVLVELSLDNGTTYDLTATLLIDVDPDLVPVVTRVDKDSWEMSKDDNSITWDKDIINAVNVSIFFATYQINDQGEVVEVLYPLMSEIPNSGQADIQVNGLPLLEDDEIQLVTFGSILIKESQGASEVTEVRLYSDIHIAMWYVRIFFIELVTRNKLGTAILPDIWNIIKNKFTQASGDDEATIKTTIKDGVIDLCTMWMSLLSQVGSEQCAQMQRNVAVSTPVPCARRQPLSDPGWIQYMVSPPKVECEQTQDRMCFIQSEPTSAGASQQGCYKMADDRLLESTVAGRPLSAHPDGIVFEDGTMIPWMIGHMVQDAEPMLFCCVWDKSSCGRFRAARPEKTCDNYKVPARGGGGGDPHFVTFDNVKFTFNGAGEFVLVKHVAGFEVQARLQPWVDSSNNPLTASAMTAVACKVNGSDEVEIRASALTGLEVVISGNVLPLVGRTQVLFNGGKLTLTFIITELKSVVIKFTTGEEVQVKQDGGSLNIVIIPHTTQQGNLEGLLGNYDGNKSNDFKPPTGAALSPSSTPQEIHDYGILWRTVEDDSLFTYQGSQTHAGLQDPDFVPTLPSSDIPVPTNCSGDIFCAFDFNVTEDWSYALATKSFFDELQTIQDDLNSGRDCPVLQLVNGGFGSGRRVGDTVAATCVDGYDVEGSSSRTCQIDLTWSGANTTCVRRARPCDGVVCSNNGTCIEENGDAICKCAVGYVGSLCQEVVTDTKIVIIVGSVVGGLLLVAIIVAVCLIVRTRPDTITDRSSEIFKNVFGDTDSRYGVPVFRGTQARRKSYNEYEYDNQGYRPTTYGDKRYNVEHRRYTREHIDGYRDSRYPYNGRPDDRGYPNNHAPHSDTEDSIDKIYRGDYEQYPRPDYDTEYTSHIDGRRPSDFDQSSGRKQPPIPPPPPEQAGRGNWLFNAARNVGVKAVKGAMRSAFHHVVEGEGNGVMDGVMDFI